MFKLDDNYLTVTPKLKEHWLRAINENHHDGLLAGFVKAGCNGQELTFKLVGKGENNKDCYVALSDTVKLYLDQRVMHVFAGGTLDLVTEGINNTVKLDGPNLDGSCGCGQSYNFGNA